MTSPGETDTAGCNHAEGKIGGLIETMIRSTGTSFLGCFPTHHRIERPNAVTSRPMELRRDSEIDYAQRDRGGGLVDDDQPRIRK
jgi:hypothetical protein